MILETLSDFFLFLSTDKKIISTQNLIDFDTFIESKFAYLDNKNSRFSIKNKEYTQLSYSLHSLLSELLYFNYKKKYIILEPEKESNILERINIKIQSEKNDNRKEINENKIIIEQTKVSLCSYLRNKELDIILDPIKFISFFNKTNERHRQTVVKFMKIIQPYLEEKAKDLSQDNIRNKTADEIDRSKSDIDKSNPNNKSGLSYISEKENLIQNKEKFINVLNKVKNNINKNNENHHRKDIEDIVHNSIHNNVINIEDINLKEIKKNNNENLKNIQNPNSIKNLVNDETKKKEDEKVIITSENNNKIKNQNQIVTTMNTNSNFDQNSENNNSRVKKDDSDCKCCSIF